MLPSHLDPAGDVATVDSVNDYFRRIRTHPVLNAAQEVELARAAEVGVLAAERLRTEEDPATRADLRSLAATGQRAVQTMIECNLRLVVSVARRYLNKGVQMADLIQDGNLGLIRGLMGFDYRLGFKFSTYATNWIKQSISHGIALQAHTIRIPQQQLLLLDTARRLRHELTVARGSTPTLEELSTYSAIEPSRLRELFKIDSGVTSLQLRVGNSESELGDLLTDVGAVDPLDRAADHEEFGALARALADLDDHDRQVLSWHFGLDGEGSVAVTEVARRLSVSRHAVNERLRISLDTLRSRLHAAVTVG